MNAIAPHGPVAQDPPDYQAPDIEPDTPFDHFLPDQPPADTSAPPNDDPPGNPTPIATGIMRPIQGKDTVDDKDSSTDPGTTMTGPVRTLRGKEVKDATANAAPPDAVFAAQSSLMADLRTVVMPVTLSPALTPPTPAKRDGVPISTDGGSGMNASSAEAPGAKATGPINSGILPRTAISPATMAVETAPKGSMPAPASILAGPGTARNAVTPGTVDVAGTASIRDSRLVAPAPAVEAQASASKLPTDEAAKIAGSKRAEPEPVQSGQPQESETTVDQNVANGVKLSGTPVAKNVDVVSNTLSTSEQEAATSAPAKRGGVDSAVTPAASRGGAHPAQGSEILVNVAVTGAATVDASTPQITTTTASESTAANQAVKVETLLQNALSVGESVRPDGQGQMEMRVRLNGGAEDVTVRMQVTNDRMQVTFQTNSPELRQALEHGWQQFSATASQTSTLTLAQPNFESSRFDAGTGGQGGNPSFSSNQQNPGQQDAGAAFQAGPSRATAAPRPGFAAIPAGQSAGGRWSGWA